MKRQEFDRKTRAAIIDRATRNGVVCCERCGMVLAGKKFEVDHILPEGLRSRDKKLVAADGQLLGECCHRGKNGKTSKDVAQIAKMKRQRDKNTGAIRPKGNIKSAGFPASAKPAPNKLPMPGPKAMFAQIGALWPAGNSRTGD